MTAVGGCSGLFYKSALDEPNIKTETNGETTEKTAPIESPLTMASSSLELSDAIKSYSPVGKYELTKNEAEDIKKMKDGLTKYGLPNMQIVGAVEAAFENGSETIKLSSRTRLN